MPITERLYDNYIGGLTVLPELSPTPSPSPWPEPEPSMVISPTPSVTSTPPISVTPSITPSTSPAVYYVYTANKYLCTITGDCSGVINGMADVYNPNSALEVGKFYTSSINDVYQIAYGGPTDGIPLGVVYVDSRPYNSCEEACSPAPCVSGSLVYTANTGWLSYTTCGGETAYQYCDCVGSCSIDACHQCGTIVSSTGPVGTGSPVTVTNIVCGYTCFIDPTPSSTPPPSNPPTPSVTKTPSVTVTPSISNTPSVTPTISNTPSVTPTIKVSPSCTCPVGYISGPDGTNCYTASIVSASLSGSTSPAGVTFHDPNRAYGVEGVRIYHPGTFDSTGTKQFGDYDYASPANTTVGQFWSKRHNANGVWATQSYWPGDGNGWVGNNPYPGTLGFCTTVNVPTTKTYYIGISGDNAATIRVNGDVFVSQGFWTCAPANTSPYSCNDENTSPNFKYWHIYPVTLQSGFNTIELQNTNTSAWGSYAAEIYDNTLAQLTSSVSTASLNIIFSTGDYLDARTVIYKQLCKAGDVSLGLCPTESFPRGKKYGQAFCTSISCPDGYTPSVDESGNNICVKYIRVDNPCDPSPTPTISVTPSKTPSVTPTISVTPTPSDTPCPTNTPSISVSVTPTPTTSLGCTCRQGVISVEGFYSYFECDGTFVSGSGGQNTAICLDVNKPYIRGIYLLNDQANCACPDLL